MKIIIRILLLSFIITPAFSQWKGLTGIPDTSFTVNSAYLKLKKEYPEVKIPSAKVPQNVKVKRNISYYQPAERPLKLDVFSPNKKSSKSHPAVLLIFGGGWRSGDRSQLVPLAIELAKNGYVAVTAEYRLSTEALYPAAVLDLKKAIVWMRSNANEFNIDTNHIATLGFSAGGQLAALVGNTSGVSKFSADRKPGDPSDKVQTIVDIDGIVAFIHPESGEGDDSKSISAATNWFGGNKEQLKELWQEASPLNYVNEKSPPIFFLNSSVDRMHAGRDDMTSRLSQYYIYWEKHSIDNTPHTFPLFHPWFEPTVKYVLHFLDKGFGIKSNK